MKLKFFLLTFTLLFARGCDFYSTSLWFFDNPEGETNLLSAFLGVGWNGLILTNLILIGLIIYAFYYYSFRYKMKKVLTQPQKLTDFVSESYYDEKGKLFQLMYKTPKNKNVMWGHIGYVLIRVVIIGSFLATIHNLCQFYSVDAYDTYREIVKRPLFVIYALILLSLGYFSYRILERIRTNEKIF